MDANVSSRRFEVKSYYTLNDVHPHEWDSISSPPFLSYKWLRFVAQTHRHFVPHYLMLYEQGKPVGKATLVLTANLGLVVSFAPARWLIRTMLNWFPMLMSGTLPSDLIGRSGLVLPQGSEHEALLAIDEHLKCDAVARKASLIILGWLDQPQYEVTLTLNDYTALTFDPVTVLDVQWQTFDDYFASLDKTTQKKFADDNRKAAQLNLHIERTHQFARHADRLWELVQNSDMYYHNLGTHPYTPDFFEIAERELADTSIMLLAWSNDTLVGFALLMHDNGLLTSFVGIDKQYKYVFFELFYDMVRYGIEQQVEQIYGSVGAYDFKYRMGFKDKPTYSAFTSTRKMFLWLANKLLPYMK